MLLALTSIQGTRVYLLREMGSRAINLNDDYRRIPDCGGLYEDCPFVAAAYGDSHSQAGTWTRAVSVAKQNVLRKV